MKICVIGLGRFGFEVATKLAANGVEVLGVDSNPSIIASIRDDITQAVCTRITDQESLESIGADSMDTVIVAMGENFAQSILITAILKQRLKISNVIVRAVSTIHKDILKILGADKIILPEKEIGRQLADTLSSPFITFARITETFAIALINAPHKFVGKRIDELDLVDKFGVNCIGLKKDDAVISIDHDYVIEENDILMFSGSHKDLLKVAKV
ncbi:MAG: TrkA family potassium uptake protein [Bacteroidota bacterium]